MPRGLTDKQRADLYKAVFDTPDGRKVLADILTKGFIFAPIPETDVSRGEGMRCLALHIMSYVGYDREHFPEEMVTTERELR